MNTEELLNQKNISFRYSGADLLIRCLSPEHEDKNPSLRIDKITGIFKCVSCGFSGNIFKHYNIEQNILDIKISNIKNKISRINKPKLYIPLSALPFEDTYRDISKETYIRFNAFTDPNDKDFDGRIIFPLIDITEEIVVFHSRYIYSELSPKYFNKPSNNSLPLFPPVPDEIINGTIILVEGFFDMLNLWDKGLKNTVCIFGASSLSNKDRNNSVVNKFAQYKLQGVNKLIIILDGDKAGQTGASNLETALKSNYIIQKIELSEGTDPGSMTQKDVDKLKEYLYG